MKIKSVFFDIDGTIYPNDIKFVKLSLPYVLSKPMLFIKFHKVRKILRNLGENYKNFYLKQAEFLSKELSISNQEAFDLVDNLIYTNWQDNVFKKIKLFEGVIETLQFLKDNNIIVGFLSDFPIRNRLSDVGISKNLYDYAFSSEEFGSLKPSHVPFQKILELTSLKPKNVVYVGNSYNYDVLGAKNLGMIAVHISNKKNADTLADYTTNNYYELKEYLKSLI